MSYTLLFSGKHERATLVDGSEVWVRVWRRPARHLLALLTFFEDGRRSELLERTVDVGVLPPGKDFESPALLAYEPASPEFIDSLDDESLARLTDIADELNFDRAVSEAEAKIARANKLLPLQEAQASIMLKPMKRELDSLMSSLTTAISKAFRENVPSMKTSPGCSTASGAPQPAEPKKPSSN